MYTQIYTVYIYKVFKKVLSYLLKILILTAVLGFYSCGDFLTNEILR